jgi:hypothetical protein
MATRSQHHKGPHCPTLRVNAASPSGTKCARCCKHPPAAGAITSRKWSCCCAPSSVKDCYAKDQPQRGILTERQPASPTLLASLPNAARPSGTKARELHAGPATATSTKIAWLGADMDGDTVSASHGGGRPHCPTLRVNAVSPSGTKTRDAASILLQQAQSTSRSLSCYGAPSCVFSLLGARPTAARPIDGAPARSTN